ncbi:MAG: 50S ribosomal protein L10 [Candidatus Zixiibacteriota bacterium]|nr:MAG: 50S ribosomal protein L10 [candidate division Zixibacteria bacterium]
MRSAEAIYFTDYRGLSAPEATKLRAKLRENNIEFTVVKKTLSFRAAQEAGFEGVTEFMQGQMALAFSFDDPAAPARILREFSKENRDIPVITGLVIGGKPMAADQAKELASLPTKEVLLGQFVSVLRQPMSRLTFTLSGAMSKLVQALSSVQSQKTS